MGGLPRQAGSACELLSLSTGGHPLSCQTLAACSLPLLKPCALKARDEQTTHLMKLCVFQHVAMGTGDFRLYVSPVPVRVCCTQRNSVSKCSYEIEERQMQGNNGSYSESKSEKKRDESEGSSVPPATGKDGGWDWTRSNDEISI